MSQPALPAGAAPTGFRHEAFTWADQDDFLHRAVGFVSDGVATGEPVLVAIAGEQWQPLCSALGDDAAQVRWLDMTTLGRNPARVIPALLSFAGDGARDGTPRRVLGQPLWPGRGPEETVECQLHEALVDVAIAPDNPFWLLCPYDGTSLAADVLDTARRSHSADGRPAGPERALAYLVDHPLAEPGQVDAEMTVARGRLSAVRALTTEHATAAGLPPSRVTDLVLAVNELAANSLDHGGGTGTVRVWRRPDALVVEVRDAGRIKDPLVGRIDPTPDQPRGRGLWMVNQLCDLVQIRPTAGGTAVRVLIWR